MTLLSIAGLVENCNRSEDSVFIGFNYLSIHDHFIQDHVYFVQIKHYLEKGVSRKLSYIYTLN